MLFRTNITLNAPEAPLPTPDVMREGPPLAPLPLGLIWLVRAGGRND
jgi:hypothetical protein